MPKRMKSIDAKKPLSFRIDGDVDDMLTKFFAKRDMRLSDIVNISLWDFLGKAENEQDKIVLGFQKRARKP